MLLKRCTPRTMGFEIILGVQRESTDHLYLISLAYSNMLKGYFACCPHVPNCSGFQSVALVRSPLYL